MIIIQNMTSKTKSILFIVEEGIIKGKNYLGSSNDLLLIRQAVVDGLSVYLITPCDIIKQSKSPCLQALKLSTNSNQKEVDREIRLALQDQIVGSLVALPILTNDKEATKSKILFGGAKIETVNINEVPIFNRAEPISLNDQFYDILINWQKNGAKILPNPYLNKIMGDKLSIYALHKNRNIDNINFFEDIDLKKHNNKISFASKIISISCNTLSSNQVAQFYDLLLAQNFQEAKKLFGEEYKIFMQGAEEYIHFHQLLSNGSVIKPVDYFSGIGVIVTQNQQLNLNQAIKNITQSFLAVKQHCQQRNSKDSPFLSKIIVQERATEAHLGDLRIVLCGKELQGIFVRVNRNFSQSNINNLYFGGHVESLFKKYPISKKGIDSMIIDITNSKFKDGDKAKDEEIKKTQALYGLLKTIDFLQQIKIFWQYPIIGIDALLTKEKDGNYRYGINEINLTSPMGQMQLLKLKIAVKLNTTALRVLKENELFTKIILKKHQILADYFKYQNINLTLQANEILLQNKSLQDLIGKEIDKLLVNNLAEKTLQHFYK